MGEFSLITGLNCSNGLLKDKLETGNLGLKTRFFKDMKKVNRQFVEQAFTFCVFPSDEDAVKLAVLYFIHFVLLTNFLIKLVPDIDFDLVESGAFENYAWGREVFNVTIESLKKKLATPRAGQIDKLKKKEKKIHFL